MTFNCKFRRIDKWYNRRLFSPLLNFFLRSACFYSPFFLYALETNFLNVDSSSRLLLLIIWILDLIIFSLILLNGSCPNVPTLIFMSWPLDSWESSCRLCSELTEQLTNWSGCFISNGQKLLIDNSKDIFSIVNLERIHSRLSLNIFINIVG